jgi:thymidylate kinase
MKHTKSTRLVSFSGIDGAGKSTQIAALRDVLIARGCKVHEIAYWDDVAVLARFRAGVSLSTLGRQTEPNDNQPLRRDKNVRAWYLTIVRSAFYVLDAVSLRAVFAKIVRTKPDYIILDRWTYDQLVHIKRRNWLARIYIKGVLKLAPTPDVPLILDARPEVAFMRKREYPLPFLHEYRQAFLELREFVPKLKIIAPGTIAEVHSQVLESVLTHRYRSTSSSRTRSPEVISDSPYS